MSETHLLDTCSPESNCSFPLANDVSRLGIIARPCDDNAQAESFFAWFKIELLEGGLFADVCEARSEAFSYIEGYYNLSSAAFKFGE